MTMNVAALPTSTAVEVDGRSVTIRALTVDDPGLADLLAAHPAPDHPDLIARALSVGARGLLTMGLGIDVAAVDARVRETLAATADEAERRTTALLEEGQRAFREQFDLDRRSSAIARALEEFAAWRDGLLGTLDPTGADSHTARFLDRLSELVGPGGDLESRLNHALDPDVDEGGIGRLAGSITEGFRELRDLIVHTQGRDEGRDHEAARGTSQGVEYEDVVEDLLRGTAAGLGGCTVERVGRETGALGARRTVGDFVVEFGGGGRVVIEAKNQSRVDLKGAAGILEELDQAMANRDAGFAVCVSCRDSFPAEVGPFGLYGDRLLVVDDGDGTMLAVALRWAEAALQARSEGRDLEIDAGYVSDRLERIRAMAERFKTTQRSLTDVGKSIDGVRTTLREMRADLVELVDDLRRELSAGHDG